MYIFGGLDDQTSVYVWAALTKLSPEVFERIVGVSEYSAVLSSYLHPFQSNQPLLWFLISTGVRLFGGNFFNFFVLFSIFLTFLFSFLFFNKLVGVYPFILAAMFSFSAYIFSHFGVHIDLMQLWLVPVFFYLLLKEFKDFFTKACVLSLFCVFAALISNYLAYFLILFFCIYSFARFMFYKEGFKVFFAFAVLTPLFAAVVFFPYIFGNKQVAEGTVDLIRPYEDFFTFSSRPWYFVLPPTKNPFLGNTSVSILQRIEDTNYFLADDYFATEHSGNYFGLVFLLFLGLVVFLAYRVGDKGFRKKQLFWLFVGFLIFLVMFPPFFTISGFKVHMPSEILYRFFPMFRSIARFSVFFHFVGLFLFAFSIKELVTHYPMKKRLLSFFVASVFTVTLLETFIPVKITYEELGSPAYVFLRDQTPEDATFAVYPYSLAVRSFYNLPVHQRYQFNLRKSGADEFTKGLVTQVGLNEARKQGVSYLFVNSVNAGVFAEEFSLEEVYRDADFVIFNLEVREP